ncbi:MAG: tRNA (N6-threonylcarbamoyladenosine(37)-N6)-methyltransferase TrmO [Acidobacteriota bacterium]
MTEMTVRSIGVIRSPFTDPGGTPIQPRFARGVAGALEVDPAYAGALNDLSGFERIWVLYLFDRARPFHAEVVPYLDTVARGLFATRSPARPNPIGMSAWRLLEVSGTIVRVADVDVLDGTPLLDIKPYVPAFDAFTDSRAGWLERALETTT